eukprot:TRINITY_DN59163_c0_g1_i1.p1 TRINITY_DN59163_c0_g1~~TRINITY_DN59163_c0_g1_i1.p1  ORF type:complete len:1097 (+),score=636.25 TRINITY_DN59163_c0_g1_i1:369-3659(+)
MTEKDTAMMADMEHQIEMLHDDPPSWMGNIVEKVRRALGNPTDTKSKELFGPSAQVVYHNVVAAIQNPQEYTPEVLSLRDALGASVKFLLLDSMVHATTVLNIALKIYPKDARLHKLMTYISLNDRTLNWRSVRLEAALMQLDLLDEPDAEVWALRGDICRELWWLERDRRLVAEQAVQCYMKSFELCKQEDRPQPDSLGYGVARAALLTSELYKVERRVGSPAGAVTQTYKENTSSYLQQLLDALKVWGDKFPRIREGRFFYYNRAFAHFGLGQVREAGEACDMFAKQLDAESAEDELAETVTKRDMRGMVKMIIFSGCTVPIDDKTESWPEQWSILARTFSRGVRGLKVTRDVIASIARGRVGLSLSGGGLRASFLHLGMLARLAECDVLRAVASISCVSGGSLVGAHMYLLVKELIESKPDEEITKQDYINLVYRLIEQFSAGTWEDMYTQTLLNPITNLRVLFGSPTRGQLLSQQLHRCFYSYRNNKRELSRPVRMIDMAVQPRGWKRSKPFEPRIHNWRRSTKVPALYLNCTNLNTGHMWRFCVTYMGERADMSGADFGVDTNAILESIRYDEAVKPEHRLITLSDCVAISSLVPGFFTPWSIKGLYSDWEVQLVDGGVFDNAGLQSLYHARTDYIICNEMGANLEDKRVNETGPISVLSRVLSISLDLTFERVYRELRDKCRQHGVTDVCFVNLKQPDLLPPDERMNYHRFIPALSKIDPERAKRLTLRQRHIKARDSVTKKQARKVLNAVTTPDVINPTVHMGMVLRSQLAHTRSSLDGFTEVERSALMATGYQLATAALTTCESSIGRWEDKGARMSIDLDRVEKLGREVLHLEEEKKNQQSDLNVKQQQLRKSSRVDTDGDGDDSTWAFFDVYAPRRDWQFSPVLTVMEEASHDVLEIDRAKGDHRKHISQVADELDVTKVSKNPAVRDLFEQLTWAKRQFAFQRVFAASKPMFFAFLTLAFAALFFFIMWGVRSFDDFSERDHAGQRSCLCVLQEPLFWTVAVILAVALLVRPGYLTLIVWEAVVLPVYALFSLYVFDIYLYRRGSTDRLMTLHRQYHKKQRKRRKSELAKQKKREAKAAKKKMKQ